MKRYSFPYVTTIGGGFNERTSFGVNRSGTNMSMSLSGDNEAELTAYYERLSAGGTIRMPLSQAPWGDLFGMCTDTFGVSWLVNIAAHKEE